jgi:hypothetical protein
MNNFRRLATSGMMVLLLSSAGAISAQYAPQPGPPPGYSGAAGWDEPSSQFNEIGRRGFHDGIEGARKDYENHRAPNVENRDEFRHPKVAKDERADYREGFRQGYDVGVRHLMQGERR